MDNRIISIASEGKGDFDLAMQLAMTTPRKTTIGYRVYENKLVLYWAPSDSMVKLPYAMNVGETINFVWGWLEAVSRLLGLCGVMPSLHTFKQRRCKLKLTLRDVAKETGVSPATISRIERGNECDFGNVKALDDLYSSKGA